MAAAASRPLYSYPGAGVPLRVYPDDLYPRSNNYPIGAHPNCWGACSELLTIREVAMMVLMDKLTDKQNWPEKIFDDAIVAKWLREAMGQPEDELYRQITDGKNETGIEQFNMPNKIPQPGGRILSEKAFHYCIEELRSKVDQFKNTNLVRVFDTSRGVIVKSDTVVAPQLHSDLKAAFHRLIEDQSGNVDWHPRSNDVVRNLVHPSMYPLIYGRSAYLKHESVGVEDAVDRWAGLGEVLPKEEKDSEPADAYSHLFSPRYRPGGSEIPPNYWSETYQWLPANLAIQQDGTVRFTSYINGLHPRKYPEIYGTIEKLIDVAIPAWDRCLSEDPSDERVGYGRTRPRVSLPDEVDDETDALWEPIDQALARSQIEPSLDDLLSIAQDEDCRERLGPEAADLDDRGILEDPAKRKQITALLQKHYGEEIKRWIWTEIREPVIPEPNEFSPDNINYSHVENIREKFRETGLQVIVKMATIELTPEKPEFPVGGWHIEGMMNEQICATALYYLDSENVTTSQLAFRMQTSYDQWDLQIKAGQDAYNWLERVHGTALGPAGGLTDSCLQNYGSVETRQGRLLVFPNTFHHRVSSFRLQDPTKPGHRRFIALWLIDPHRRIISTANVPPQQMDWWAEAVAAGHVDLEKMNLSPDVLQAIREYRETRGRAEEEEGIRGDSVKDLMTMLRDKNLVPKGLIDVEEAKDHRLKLMDERSRFHESSEGHWAQMDYSFCEH
ncbi:hypothetical protein GQ53DRAFT_747386 [Thozetella sp. PMI_491]|nr:hypothetical protein GQ53DRAFT_747386 [Thozetella sp. PMI_491]